MKKYFYFGEKVKKYDVRVLNEREIRAAAGILLILALTAFFNVWFTGNFYLMKIFVITFLIDFFIRVLINPKYSPSMILGRLSVNNQEVEYVGAPQKRFAWGIGLLLSGAMFYLTIINNFFGPLNLIICLICLIFLFLETSFGVCMGCKIYNTVTGKEARLCPGGTCSVLKKEKIQQISYQQIIIVALFFFSIILIAFLLQEKNTTKTQNNENLNCPIPQWAKDIGHEEMYKLHHGCE